MPINRRKQNGTSVRISYFEPKTWGFWRALIISFCVCSWLGHWLEIPYTNIMDALFGIVDDDYAAAVDPWFFPYRIYGYGALFMTLLLEPCKEWFMSRSKTAPRALLKMLVAAIILSGILETVFGLIVNQPDAYGEYPFWDNSALPGNILGQGWIVNDLFIGIVAMVYLWLILPVICTLLNKIPKCAANTVCAIVVVVFLACLLIPSFLGLVV